MHFSSAFLFTFSALLLGSNALKIEKNGPAGAATTSATISGTTSQATPLTIQIPIDHFSSSNKDTYSNRYWVNSQYYKSGSPVFFMDVGEEGVDEDFVDGYLGAASGTYQSAAMALAQKYNGLAILFEHRFYGKSLPFPIDSKTGLVKAGWQGYQYLTVEQALEDVVYLAEHFQPKGLEQYWDVLAPTKTPWIFIGGSYPGARAAWIRIRNPDVIYASWASSGPVQTTVDMATYYEQIYTDMTGNCSADMAAASQYLTDTLNSGSQRDIALVNSLITLAQDTSNASSYTRMTDQQIESFSKSGPDTDFTDAYVLADFVTGNVQSYGFSVALQPYCDAVEAFDPTQIDNSSIAKTISTTLQNTVDDKPQPKGIAANYGPQAAFLAIIYGIAAQDIGTPPATGDGMSWTFQTCTEMGFFQVSNTSSPNNLLSTFINVTSWDQTQCQENFPYPELPKAPNAQALVDKYGGWKMNPSNVMFTDGLKDPWHTLSTQSTSSEIGAPNRATVQDIPDCNKSPDSSKVFGITYPESYHVSDLSGTKSSATQGLALFEHALDKWIPCFQSHSITSNSTSTSSASPSSSSGTSSSGGGSNGGNGGTTTSGGSGTGTSASPAASSSKTGSAGGIADSRNVQLGLAVAGLAAVLAF